MSRYLFSTFDVTRQVIHTSKLSLAIVNLKPLLPGHVLVLPHRVVPRLTDLDSNEVSDLFLMVQRVGRVVESAYNAEALTISIQDGISAGQSVPHVHVHILPRFSTDFKGNNDDIYPALETSEQDLRGDLEKSKAEQKSDSVVPQMDQASQEVDVDSGSRNAGAGIREIGRAWQGVEDQDRRPRSMEEMEKEALWLQGFF